MGVQLLSPCAWSSLSSDKMEHAGVPLHHFAVQPADKMLYRPSESLCICPAPDEADTLMRQTPMVNKNEILGKPHLQASSTWWLLGSTAHEVMPPSPVLSSCRGWGWLTFQVCRTPARSEADTKLPGAAEIKAATLDPAGCLGKLATCNMRLYQISMCGHEDRKSGPPGLLDGARRVH